MYGCVLERRERPGGIAGIKWFSSPTPAAWLGLATGVAEASEAGDEWWFKKGEGHETQY